MDQNAFYEYVRQKQPNICQIVVLQNGKTVLNSCWNGYTASDTVHTMSATKSVVSLLVGIAIDKGLIGSIDDPVLQYFPNYTIKRGEKTIQQVALRHLLTMTAPYKYRSEPWTKICLQNDWTTAALDFLGGRKGMNGEFFYSTLGIHILTGIIAQKSGMTTAEFANTHLFAPLNIAPRSVYVAPDAAAHKAFTVEKTPKGRIWFSDPCGVGTAGYGLCLSAGEMAKIGQLCLQNGCYQDKKLVSSNWIAEMSRTQTTLSSDKFRGMKYGYLWWIIDEQEGSFAAIGNSGNVIYINPAMQLTAAVSAFFKPSVLDRIDFIRKDIEGALKSGAGF